MFFVILYLFVTFAVTIGGMTNNVDDVLNWCLDSQNHKGIPGPEDSLHGQCTPWASRSCCTLNTTHNVHNVNMYNFNFNHCGHIQNLSQSCRRHFVQDLCFYECSPNIGPWVVKVNNKFRKERFFKVPLCASDCDAWFQDCIDDFTCTDNWAGNFVWKNGQNTCPAGARCRKFSEIFHSSKNFCEKVWDGSWEYTPDDSSCMRIWFDSAAGNPNDAVAKRAYELQNSKKTSGQSAILFSTTLLSVTLVVPFL